MSVQDERFIVKHETWTRKLDFLVSSMALCVGLGNVWRFPYLCYKHGGGAFLIAYIMTAVISGVPLFYIECFLGQARRRSAYIAWRFCPIMSGLGFGFMVVNGYLGIYLVVIMSWVFYYLFASFRSPLPWTYCDPAWATNRCRTNFTQVLHNSSYYTDPVNEYFMNHVLRLTTSIENVGGLNYPLAGYLLLSYTICYFVIWKGIRVSGKIMYFTALLPFVMIIILLFRSVTLKGAAEGIKYYLLPDFRKLASLQLWSDAGAQIFFSYGLASGILTALASHNQPDHNIYLDSIRTSLVNSGCSFISGFVIFPVLGFMSLRQNVPIDAVADSGPGLAFIAYPRALAELTGSNFWSFLFFLALIFIGIDSAFITLETTVLSIEDMLEGHFKINHRKEILTLILVVISFLISLTMVTNGGMYVFQLFNYFPISQVLILTAFLEVISFSWIYGYERFQNDIKLLSLNQQGKIFKFILTVLAPMWTMITFILNIIVSGDLTYMGYSYPTWAIVVGWLLTCTIVVPIIGIAAYNFYQLDEPNIWRRFLLMFKCTDLYENETTVEEKQINENFNDL